MCCLELLNTAFKKLLQSYDNNQAEEFFHRGNKVQVGLEDSSRDTSRFKSKRKFRTMPADFDTFRSVLIYCVALLALPITTFFLSKCIIFDGILQLDNVHSNVYSAVSAILMLHVNLGMFIYKAYSSDEVPKKPEKLD